MTPLTWMHPTHFARLPAVPRIPDFSYGHQPSPNSASGSILRKLLRLSSWFETPQTLVYPWKSYGACEDGDALARSLIKLSIGRLRC